MLLENAMTSFSLWFHRTFLEKTRKKGKNKVQKKPVFYREVASSCT